MVRRKNQLTLRDIDPRVLSEIERVSRAEGLSMNKAAAKILKQGVGLREATEQRQIGTAVNRFVGSLPANEAQKLSRTLRSLERVDRELWK